MQLCVPELIQLYNMLYNRWMDYYNNSVPGPFYSKRQAKHWIVAGLVLTVLVKPCNMPYIILVGNKVLEGEMVKTIDDKLLEYIILTWAKADDKIINCSERQARRIVREVLGVTTRKARLAGLANIACKYGLERAAEYYGSTPLYTYQLLKYYSKARI